MLSDTINLSFWLCVVNYLSAPGKREKMLLSVTCWRFMLHSVVHAEVRVAGRDKRGRQRTTKPASWKTYNQSCWLTQNNSVEMTVLSVIWAMDTLIGQDPCWGKNKVKKLFLLLLDYDVPAFLVVVHFISLQVKRKDDITWNEVKWHHQYCLKQRSCCNSFYWLLFRWQNCFN